MPGSWGPSKVGKLITSAPEWTLALDGEQFMLTVEGTTFQDGVLSLADLDVKTGLIWATLRFTLGKGQWRTLGGIPNRKAHELHKTVHQAVEDIKYRAYVVGLIQGFKSVQVKLLAWATEMTQAAKSQLRMKGWLSGEFIKRQIQSKPADLDRLLSKPEVIKHIEGESPQVQEAAKLWKHDLQDFFNNINERHLAKQIVDFKPFFDTVEKSPLTQEQAKAVVCFDNRVLLVASAGSGKTSTMVAKAGYALQNGYFEPERMLLLAFNNDAAKELGQRIKERLGPIGLPADKVMAKTFHAFGLDVIGQATGKRPSLAPWVETGRDLEHLLSIVDDLKDRDIVFRAYWDLFRIVLGQDLPKFGKEEDAPDSWDKKTKLEGFWTLNNEVVKSRGEQVIANWLFYNGINYVYEAPYEVDTADAQHRQYKPDFYFPDAKTYLEHWALDDNGEPPAAFVGYREGMAWKRQVHATNGTKLLETTMAELWSGKAFRYLEAELPKLGLNLDPDPERPAPGRKPIENPRLARTFRSFMTHAKSNRLSPEELRARLGSGVAGEFRFRHTMFLDLFEKISGEWEARLKQEKCIDFEDMLNLATDCVEQGQWTSPYELVMVDEFQDASLARARLVAGLVGGADKHLFAVGDDWQSINRFAGADLAVMTDFESRFGRAVMLKLETTFRCPQSLCDISSKFVQRNPKQLRKVVRSSQPPVDGPVRIVRVRDELQIRMAVSRRIEEIACTVAPGRKEKVLVLGRYQKDRDYLPPGYDQSRIDLEFITVHSSKGLEGDHVIMPRMTSETLGFPSRVADDPVLQLAMPGGDSFEFAEERRLFCLNGTGIKTDLERDWTRATVHEVLINEKYIGTNVYNRISFKLRKLRVINPSDMWIRKEDAFVPLIAKEDFYTAQGIIRARSRRFTDDELIERLRTLYRDRQALSGFIINSADGMPSSSVYAQRFGSLIRAYQLVGFTPARDYQYIEVNRVLRRLHPEIVAQTEEQMTALGGSVRRQPTTDLLDVNDEFSVSLVLARCHQREAGQLSWKVRFDLGLSPDLTVAVRLAPGNERALDYYLLPHLDFSVPRIHLGERNPVELENYRFENLDYLYGMAARTRLRRAA